MHAISEACFRKDNSCNVSINSGCPDQRPEATGTVVEPEGSFTLRTIQDGPLSSKNAFHAHTDMPTMERQQQVSQPPGMQFKHETSHQMSTSQHLAAPCLQTTAPLSQATTRFVHNGVLHNSKGNDGHHNSNERHNDDQHQHEYGGFFQFQPQRLDSPAPPGPFLPGQPGGGPPQPPNGPCSTAMPQSGGPIGRVGTFELDKWQISLSKIPVFTTFDGTTQHYRAWKIQLENWLSTVNPDWITVLNMVENCHMKSKNRLTTTRQTFWDSRGTTYDSYRAWHGLFLQPLFMSFISLSSKLYPAGLAGTALRSTESCIFTTGAAQ